MGLLIWSPASPLFHHSGVRMKTKSILLLIMVSLLVGSLGEFKARAESPFDYLFFPFKKVDADPQVDYRVTEK